jgi:hypothetical protein
MTSGATASAQFRDAATLAPSQAGSQGSGGGELNGVNFQTPAEARA